MFIDKFALFIQKTKNSFILDLKFLKISKWSLRKKIIFILIKDFSILKHFLKPFKLSRDSVCLFNSRIYYESRFGLGPYQEYLVRQRGLIKIAGLERASTVIDVGANVGFFSKMIREAFPTCSIYCIEPIPTTFQCLKLNFINDPLTHLFKCAISDKQGASMMHFEERYSPISRIDPSGNISVCIETLDNFILGNNVSSIDLLKIDAETFEAHVLRGAIRTLSITQYLHLEITILKNPNYTISSLLSLLYSEKYNFQLVAFKNYDNVSEGTISVMDAVFKNINLV